MAGRLTSFLVPFRPFCEGKRDVFTYDTEKPGRVANGTRTRFVTWYGAAEDKISHMNLARERDGSAGATRSRFVILKHNREPLGRIPYTA